MPVWYLKNKVNNMKNIKFLWGVIFVLLIVSSLLGYKFTVGSVEVSQGERISVILTKDERNLILNEMRQSLISVQVIGQAIANNKTDNVVILATKAGMAAEADTPGAIFRKIPLAMKKLGFDTRRKFDAIATAAKEGKNQQFLRKQLDSLLSNCIACHATYQMPEAKDKK